MIEEQQIIDKCLAGKQSAYKELYNSYYGYCFTICTRYGISSFEMKDMLQTIFMEVFKSLERFDAAKAQFKTWMTRITINQILMHKRKKKINYDQLDDHVHVAEDHFIDAGSEIDKEKLYAILSKMPEQFITVFNLAIIEGYSHKEIAEKLDISEGSSRILLHRGRTWAMNEMRFFLGKTEFKKAL